MARFTIAEKKEFLTEYSQCKHRESQRAFCERRGILPQTFSKWLRHADDILQTPNQRKNRDPSESKRLLRNHIQALSNMGVTVQVTEVMRFGQQHYPDVFATVQDYNGRYQLCLRLLHEVQSSERRQTPPATALARKRHEEKPSSQAMQGAGQATSTQAPPDFTPVSPTRTCSAQPRNQEASYDLSNPRIHHFLNSEHDEYASDSNSSSSSEESLEDGDVNSEYFFEEVTVHVSPNYQCIV